MADNVVEIQIKVVGADQATREIEKLSGNIGVKGVALGTVLGTAITKGLELAVSGVKSIIGGIGDAVKAAASFEDIEVSLTAMTGSSKIAKKALADLQNLIQKTPLQLEEAQQSLTKLIGVGFNTDDAIKKIGQLSDVLSGTGRTDLLDNVIFNLGQIRSQGKASTMDLRQFASAGIPIYEELKKVLGVSGEKLQDMVEDGKIGIKEIEKVMESLTGKGGRFFQLSEKRSKTLNGILSNIKDTMFITLANIAKETGLFDLAKNAASGFYEFINANQGKFIQLLKDAIKFAQKLGEGITNGAAFKAIQEAIKVIGAELPKILPSLMNFVKALDTLASSKAVSFIAENLVKLFQGIAQVDIVGAAGKMDMLSSAISALGKALSGDLVGAEKDINKVADAGIKMSQNLLGVFGFDLNQAVINFSTNLTIKLNELAVKFKTFVNDLRIGAAQVRVAMAEAVGDTATADAFKQQIANMRIENETLALSLDRSKQSLTDFNFLLSNMPQPTTFAETQQLGAKTEEYARALSDAGIQMSSLKSISSEALQKITTESTNSRMFVKGISDELSKVTTNANAINRTDLSPFANKLKVVQSEANKAKAAVGGISSGFARLKPGNVVSPFAEGGIVGGSSSGGDRQLARVNSGEMIINRNDQAALFKLIKGMANKPQQVINANFNQNGRGDMQSMNMLSYILAGN